MKIDRQVLAYFSVLLTILLLVLFSSRKVLFVPWTGRSWASAAQNMESVYITGGLDIHNEMNDQILCVDLQDRTLKKAGYLPGPRYSTASVYYDSAVYVLGGYSEEGYLDEIVRFDPDEQASEIILRFDEPRCYGTVELLNGSLYYLGGFNGSKVVDSILKIDIESGVISETAKLPRPVNFHSSAVIGDKIVILGGENGKGDSITDIYEINPETGEISREGDLPSPLIRSSASVSGDHIYMLGGWGQGGPQNHIIRIDLNAADLDGRNIRRMDRKESDIPLLTFRGSLYYIGGVEERFRRQLNVLSFNPEDGSLGDIKLKSYAWWH